MLLGKKTKPEKQAKWALILDRAQDELSKNRTITKLSQSFPLSMPEARDLVENTPLILLDDLSHEEGAMVKEYFSKAKVDCFLTSDTLTKRKCFRTVWPEPLDLNALLAAGQRHGEPEANVATVDSDPGQVLTSPVPPEPRSASPTFPEPEPPRRESPSQQVLKEQKQLRALTLELQKENEKLRFQIERVADEVKARERERFAASAKEFETDRARLEQEVRRIRDENVTLHSDVVRLKEEIKQREEAAERRAVEEANRQSAAWKAQLDEFRSEQQRLQALLEEAQRESQRSQMQLTQEQDARQHVENKMAQLDAVRSERERLEVIVREAQQDRKRLQMELVQEKDARRQAENEIVQQESTWQQTQLDLSAVRAESERLRQRLSEAQTSSVQFKNELEQTRTELAQRVESLEAELEQWKRKASDLSAGYSKVMKENEFLRTQQNEELEGLRARNNELMTQLEGAQKQIRNFTSQLEQQELIRKRMKAGSELAEHEAKLKTLVERQRTLEADLQRSEEGLRTVLHDQEEVEHEIMKVKQVQKYLMEQTKIKGKNRLAGATSEREPLEPFEDVGANLS